MTVGKLRDLTIDRPANVQQVSHVRQSQFNRVFVHVPRRPLVEFSICTVYNRLLLFVAQHRTPLFNPSLWAAAAIFWSEMDGTREGHPIR
jgi:hypothetical protein